MAPLPCLLSPGVGLLIPPSAAVPTDLPLRTRSLHRNLGSSSLPEPQRPPSRTAGARLPHQTPGQDATTYSHPSGTFPSLHLLPAVRLFAPNTSNSEQEERPGRAQGQRTPVLLRPQQPRGEGGLQGAAAHGRPTDMSQAQGRGLEAALPAQ